MAAITGAASSQDMPTLQPLWPLSARLCNLCSLLLTIACACILTFTGIAPRAELPDPGVPAHCGMAMLLVVSALIAELCFAVSSMVTKSMLHGKSEQLILNHGLGDAVLTMTEYSLKCCGGMYLWYYNGGIMHESPSMYVGGSPRTVYFARLFQWSLASPIIVLIVNRMFLAPDGFKMMLLRSVPGMICTFVYCLATYVMAITECFTAMWSLFFLVLSSFTVVSVDQVQIAYECQNASFFDAKLGILVYEIISFAVYALVFMLGRFDIISPFAEQVFYAYADSGVKVLHGAMLAMIRQVESLSCIGHWWSESMHAKQDVEYLISAACVPIFAMDPGGKIISWNDAMTKLTGLHAEDAVGQALMTLVAGETRQILQTAWNGVIEASTPRSGFQGLQSYEQATGVFELQMSRRNSPEKVVLLVNMAPRQSKEGVLESVVAIGQDVSEVAQLKAVEEKKNQLMGVVSHELRSPLHGIIGLTGMMADSAQASAGGMVRKLTMVKGCASRLLDLVTNVMDMSEDLKSGELVGHRMMPVNWLDIAEEVVVMTSLAVDKANRPLVRTSVRLVNNVSKLDKIPMVLGDPYKCTQLLYNLVTNACKFTMAGSVTIQAEVNDDQSRVEIQVIDTGSGIPEDAQKRIFIPFEQEGSSEGDARHFQGIGLGLAVVKVIAELHAAPIRVSSKVGFGSTFGVSFACGAEVFPKKEPLAYWPPLAEASPVLAYALDGVPILGPYGLDGRLMQVPETLTKTIGSSDVKPARTQEQSPMLRTSDARCIVLSVDDDMVNQEIINCALGAEYDIVYCMDGQAALNYLCGRREKKLSLPDVVLLDIQMPGLTGFEVCRTIRSTYESSTAKLPIIMVSAKAPADAVAIESMDVGSTDFIPKPFDIGVLQRKVKLAVGIRHQIYNRLELAADDNSASASAALADALASAALAEALSSALAEKFRSENLDLQKRLLELEACREAELQAAQRDRARLEKAEQELLLLSRSQSDGDLDREKKARRTSREPSLASLEGSEVSSGNGDSTFGRRPSFTLGVSLRQANAEKENLWLRQALAEKEELLMMLSRCMSGELQQLEDGGGSTSEPQGPASSSGTPEASCSSETTTSTGSPSLEEVPERLRGELRLRRPAPVVCGS
ncbi:unnamed protein product [Polarella glacialis]|uniref:histidine kinase n=1 Tax=Polarella glacialis TaxID=89957 RepID=A0A813ILU9_POLGL|nr:unnamed protein product [Polarella glacialis]